MGQLPIDTSVSHSHAVDSQPAPATQRSLRQLTHRCHERRALEVFLDTTGLAAQPALWTSSREALG